MVTPTQRDYDIVIIGGGLAGLSLACALGGSRFSVLVLEAGETPGEPADEYDLRVSAITPASHNLFVAVGAWDGMVRRRMGHVRRMVIWDAGGTGSVNLDTDEGMQTELAWIIENGIIRRALAERLERVDNVDYVDRAGIEGIEIDASGARVQLASGQAVTTRLVVGADGAASRTRELSGIETHGHSFEQTAIVATVQTERSHADTAWQRFLPTGPLAFLPLDDPHTSSIVWSADTAYAQQLLGLDDAAFTDALEQALESRLGKVTAVSRRAGFPLSLMHADHYVSDRIVLVADAAHRLHPLAGQGLNLGLADVAALAEVLLSATHDIGSQRVLRRYERWRRGDNSLMLGLMDGFKRLYGTEQPLVAGVRNFGMDLVDSNTWLKRLVMQFAAGTQGDTPPLLRG